MVEHPPGGAEHTTQLPGLTGTGPLAFGSFTFDPEQSAGGFQTVGAAGDHRTPQRARVADGGGRRRPGTARTRVGAAGPKAVRVVADEEAERRWCRRVAEAVARIERNGLEKVVLARSVRARAAEPLDVRHLVDTLARDYPSCWTYAVDGLVGASPEMLVRRERGLATSRILAGTIRRSGWEETDLKLASSLARSSKNLAEHELGGGVRRRSAGAAVLGHERARVALRPRNCPTCCTWPPTSRRSPTRDALVTAVGGGPAPECGGVRHADVRGTRGNR